MFTDGERRYGNLLFEICQEVLRTGKPGRPKKTLPKGVKVRIKNKGSQSGMLIEPFLLNRPSADLSTSTNMV